jgi:hypothetical protein
MSWKALQHPNVLSLIGVVATEAEFAIVSEWMLNGNINQFIEGCQDANRFELVGFCPIPCNPHHLLTVDNYGTHS